MRVYPCVMRRAIAGALLGLLVVTDVVASGTLRPRIVNGVPTQARPTTGVLLQAYPNTFHAGFCSATLVGCQHVVTAAHCVCAGDDFASCGTPSTASLRVYLQHAGILAVSAADVNPAYAFSVAGDVAVLTLTQPVTGIRPTPINTTANPSAGTTATIAGYGITDGANDDFGLLRQGAVTLAACSGVPEPAHVCWTYDHPIGSPGTDSDTCSGDSGGPLFVDFGGGEVLAGVTSGGSSADCRPTDLSFDSNVFQNAAFIQSIAGGDLGPASCGTISQVGDPATTVTTLQFGSLGTDAQRCRTEVRKRYESYTKTRLKLMRRCVDRVQRGSATPCPDASTAAAIARAATRVDPLRLGLRCPASVVPAIGAAGPCTGAANADDLSACILAAGDAAADAMVDAEYADPTAAPGNAGLFACQLVIGKAASKYGLAVLKLGTKCQGYLDAGKVGACPDTTSQAKEAELAAKVLPAIQGSCSDAQVQLLDAAGTFGGGCAGSATTAAIAACEIAAHALEVDTLVGALSEVGTQREVSLTVPPGAATLRFTLNGIDAGLNDVDLYVRQGAPPTTSAFDARSINVGVYDGIEIPSPASGTWYVLVDPYAGGNVPFQMTATVFQ